MGGWEQYRPRLLGVGLAAPHAHPHLPCRAAYNMSEGQQGLLVRQVEPLGSCAGQVQEGDVLTK